MKKLISILLVAVMLLAMIPAMAFNTSAATTSTWLDEWDLTWYTDVMGKTTVESDAVEAANNDGIVYVYETSEAGSDRISVTITTENKTFYIDTAAELAGLAKICDMENKSYFLNSTFYITADIDLDGRLWYPIAHKYGAFRANLIGSKGASDSTNTGNGGSVQIKNMTCNITANYAVGLIGIYKTGTIENLEMVNASITALSYTVGSFVGWNADIATGFENLKSDAAITLTSQRADRYDCVGGIIGCSNNGYISNGIKNCVFTGSIDAPYGDNVGGIIGTYEETQDSNGTDKSAKRKDLIIENCVVASDYIKVGKNNYYLSGGNDGDIGFGGIIGRSTMDEKNSDGEYTHLYLTNCYVAADIVIYDSEVEGKLNRGAGGLIGNLWAIPTDISNCQFDGTISGKMDRVGSMVSRVMNTADTPLKYTNCVSTGVAFNGNDPEKKGFIQNAFTWNGRSTNTGWSVENCYSAMSQKVASAVNSSLMTPITANTTFTGLDFKNTWATVDNSNYPILKVALPYVDAKSPSIVMSGADLSSCDPSATAAKITTDAQVKGLAIVLGTIDGYETTLRDKITVTANIATADLSILDKTTADQIKTDLHISDNVNDEIISMAFAQKSVSANEDGTYDVRVTSLIKGSDYTDITFDVAASRTDNGVTKYASFVQSEKITTCYKSVIEVTDDGDVPHTADDGYYYVVFVIRSVDLSYADTVFTVRGNATSADGVCQSTAVNYHVN